MIPKDLSLILLLFFCIGVAKSQEGKNIEILSTDYLEYNINSGTNAKKLIGNVHFQHENAQMFCDSAYFYTEINKVDAFGNVSIHQGDTLHLYGKFFSYDGNTRTAKMQDNVKLIDKETTLTTNYLEYKIVEGIGYYVNGGNIINKENTLKSNHGSYYTKIKLFYFKDDVEVINPKYIIKSDTLQYNTQSRIAYFFGPTDIISKDNFLHCENGWYNTKTDISEFRKKAYLTMPKRMLAGDSLYYDRRKGLGKAYGNVFIIDSSQNTIIKGLKAFYIEKPEYALITDSAHLIFFQNTDSLYLHADTLMSITVNDTLQQKEIKAYHKVKFYRFDIQGMADSAVFKTSDSTLYMYYNPVIWSENNQIFATKIELHLANNQINTADFNDKCFIIAKEDSDKFSQVKGKNMKGYFKNNEIYKLAVSGNGQTIYYAKDKNKIIGVNRANCSNIDVLFKKRKITKIAFLTQPDAVLYPLSKFPSEEKYLSDFKWYEEFRPLCPLDIFK